MCIVLWAECSVYVLQRVVSQDGRSFTSLRLVVVLVCGNVPSLLSRRDRGQRWLKCRGMTRCRCRTAEVLRLVVVIRAIGHVHVAAILLFHFTNGMLSSTYFIFAIVHVDGDVSILSSHWTRQSSQLPAASNADSPRQGGLVSRTLSTDLNALRAIRPFAIADDVASLATGKAVVGCTARSGSASPLLRWRGARASSGHGDGGEAY